MSRRGSILSTTVAIGVVAASAAGVHMVRVAADAEAGDAGEPRFSAAGHPSDPRPKSASGYYKYLRSLGLTENETKPLILAYVESSVPRRRAERIRYWQRDDTAALRAARAEIAAAERVRAQLRAVYGGEADLDAAFDRVFRPLGERFAFLSSRQQIAIQKARVDFRLAAAEDPGNGPAAFVVGRRAGASGGPTQPLHPEASPAWGAVLESILGQGSLLEYQLRESALAQEIRNSGVALTEDEFREVYGALEALAERPDSAGYRSARRTLRALLGGQRFDELWARRDPVYSVVHEIMSGLDYPDATILAAYGVLNRTQDSLVDAAERGGSDPLRALDDAREIAALEQRQLAGIVGDETARQILTARAQTLFELSQQASVIP